MPPVPTFNPVLKANAAKHKCALLRFEIDGKYLEKRSGSITATLALSEKQYQKFHKLFREFVSNCPMEKGIPK